MKPRALSEIPAKFHASILAQLAPVSSRLRHPEPKPDAQLLPLGKDAHEGGGPGRFRVRITRVGAKLLDADNLAGSVKFVLDACRYKRLISDDSPEAITLEVSQRIAPRDERGTIIEIDRL